MSARHLLFSSSQQQSPKNLNPELSLRSITKMFATRALRQASQHAERVPLIKFLGKRSIPGMFSPTLDSTPAQIANKLFSQLPLTTPPSPTLSLQPTLSHPPSILPTARSAPTVTTLNNSDLCARPSGRLMRASAARLAQNSGRSLPLRVITLTATSFPPASTASP